MQGTVDYGSARERSPGDQRFLHSTRSADGSHHRDELTAFRRVRDTGLSRAKSQTVLVVANNDKRAPRAV